MAASTPLTVHQELDLLDQIEQAMVTLTTADLVPGETQAAPLPPALPDPHQTVISSHSPE